MAKGWIGGLFKSGRPSEDTGDRIERVEKAMRRLEEEWSEVYHKFRVLQMRVAKQAQRIDAQAPETEVPQPAEGDGEATASSSLSERQRAIQARILARRNRLPMLPQKGGE